MLPLAATKFMSGQHRESRMSEKHQLSLAEVMCPVCLSILIEPVTMPCGHELCMPCFKKNVRESSLCCPMCRQRISSWARKASRQNVLVNMTRWDEIRRCFPEQCEHRLKGIEDDITEEEMYPVEIHLAEPGEIRKEYEDELNKIRAQRAEERKEEEEESAKVIEQLQAEEELRRQEAERQRLCDELLATEIHAKLMQTDQTPDINRLHLQCLQKLDTNAINVTSQKTGAMDKFVKKRNTDPGGDVYPYSCISPSEKPEFHPYRVEVPTESRATEPYGKDSRATQPYGKLNMSSDSLNLSQSYTSMNNSGKFTKSCINIKSETVSKTECPVPGTAASISESVVSPGFTTSNPTAPRRSRSVQSEDSISQELVHFRPIRACPKTPPRPSASGRLVEPPLVLSTPINSSHNLHSQLESSNEDILQPASNLSSPLMARRLQSLESERKQHVEELSKSTWTPGGQVQESIMKKLKSELGKVAGKKRNIDLTNLDFINYEGNSKKMKNSQNVSSASVSELNISADSIIPLESNFEVSDDFDPFGDSSDSDCEVLFTTKNNNNNVSPSSSTKGQGSGSSNNLNNDSDSHAWCADCGAILTQCQCDIVIRRRTSSSKRSLRNTSADNSAFNTPAVSDSLQSPVPGGSTSSLTDEVVSHLKSEDNLDVQKDTINSLSAASKKTKNAKTYGRKKLKLNKKSVTSSQGQSNITEYFIKKSEIEKSEFEVTTSCQHSDDCKLLVTPVSERTLHHASNYREVVQPKHCRKIVFRQKKTVGSQKSVGSSVKSQTVNRSSLRNVEKSQSIVKSLKKTNGVSRKNHSEHLNESSESSSDGSEAEFEDSQSSKSFSVTPNSKRTELRRFLRKRTVKSYAENESTDLEESLITSKCRRHNTRNKRSFGESGIDSENQDLDESLITNKYRRNCRSNGNESEDGDLDESLIISKFKRPHPRRKRTCGKSGNGSEDGDSNKNQKSASKKDVDNREEERVNKSKTKKLKPKAKLKGGNESGDTLSKAKTCKRVRKIEDERSSDVNVEERDRLLALRLQKQFDFEAKFSTVNRSKGSKDAYEFRQKRSRKTKH